MRIEAPAPLRWWRETAFLAIGYVAYSLCRNLFGSASVSPATALANSRAIIDIERALGLYHEAAIQAAFLPHAGLVGVFNTFYATAHFVMPVAVLVVLLRRSAIHYRRWRNVLAVTTLSSLVLFALFPVMPPRLIGSCGPFGACATSPFVDTLATFGGPWSFDSGPVSEVSNQFAAMPSLHFAWALWCWVALRSVLTTRTGRLAAAAYPALTLLTIVVTGNHFVLDAVGGAVVVLAAVAAVGTSAVTDPFSADGRLRASGA